MAGEAETTKPFRGVLPLPGAGAPTAGTGRIGPYTVLGELGRGGMGVVYRALDTSLGRPVALKMIIDPSRAGPEEVARFEREAKAAARLRHPGIVQVFGTGLHEGRPYIVLELVEGESFAELLKRGPLPPRRTAEIVLKLGRALAYAHEQGVIHRDVKPQNVLIDADGEPRLMDFGLARDSAATAQLTHTGDVLGTPSFMAPEQADGRPGEQGPATDVYALGAVLYRALVGRPPFEAPNVQALLYKVLTQEPDPPRAVAPGVHADLETIALRCLEKSPARRYPTAGDVAEELRRFLDGEPIASRPIGPIERAWRWARRRKVFSAVTVALLVALLGAGGLELVRRSRERAGRLAAAAALVRERQDQLRTASEQLDLEWFKSDKSSLAHGKVTSKVVSAASDLIVALDQQRSLAGADDPAATRQLFEGYLTAAGALEDEMWTLEGAIEDCRRAIALHVDDARARRSLETAEARVSTFTRLETANSLLAAGWRASSEEVCTRILAAEPGNAKALFMRAEVRVLLGRYEEGIADYTRLMDSPKKHNLSAVLALRGRARLVGGDVEGAQADFDLAIRESSTNGDAWHFRALVKRHRKDFEGALSDLEKAMGCTTAFAHLIVTLEHAIALFQLGKREPALAEITKLIDENGATVPEAWKERGRMRALIGDLAGAAQDWRRYLELRPPPTEAALIESWLTALEQGRGPSTPGDGR